MLNQIHYSSLISAVVIAFTLISYCAKTLAEKIPDRPKIGLVLAGGGAKGTAHVGVLKVLEEQRIPIDFITGTSIGSVVGGLYALGYDAKTIEEKMLSIDFNRGYSDAIPRENLRYRRKQQKDQFNIPVELGLKNGALTMPTGALQGQSMNQIIRELIGLVPDQESFDNLAIPYRAIATDLSSRETIVIDQGSLVSAMRASSSVPGALAPEPYKGRLLVDGGLSNNIPIAEAKDLGADIIIAVDISSDLKEQKDITGALAVIGQLSAFLTTEGTQRQLEKLEPNDILLSPKIESMSMTDFSIMPEALAAGETAAREQLTQLQKLAVSEDEYNRYIEQRQAKQKTLVTLSNENIQSVIIDNKSSVHIDYIEHYLSVLPGQIIEVNTINEAIDRIYSSDEFQKVDLHLQQDDDDNRTLIITTEEKSWGPNYLEFGLGWEEDITDDSVFNLDFAITATNLTSYGAQWRTQLEIGHEQSIRSHFYAPIVPTRVLYSRFTYEYETKKWDWYQQNIQFLTLNTKSHIIHLGLGWNFHQSGFIEVGARGEYGKISNASIMSDLKFTSKAPYLLLGFDTLNSISFPTQGRRFTVSLYSPLENIKKYDNSVISFMDETSRSQVIDLDWKGAIRISNHSFVSKAAFSKIFNDNDESVYYTELGGFLNLSGYHHDALSGSSKAFGALIYQWDLGRSALDLDRFPLYLGFSAEIGKVWQLEAPSATSATNDTITAASIFLGTDTRLGPAAIAVGATDDKNHAVYFYLGKSF